MKAIIFVKNVKIANVEFFGEKLIDSFTKKLNEVGIQEIVIEEALSEKNIFGEVSNLSSVFSLNQDTLNINGFIPFASKENLETIVTMLKEEKSLSDIKIDEDNFHFTQIVDSKSYLKSLQNLKLLVNAKHIDNDVIILDESSTYISPEAIIGKNTVINPQTFIFGNSVIGENCVIGPSAKIDNCVVNDSVTAQFCVMTKSTIGEGTSVGPFAYVRPNCNIGKNCKIGDFVEVKNSVIGDKSKASHLTYIGDSKVGKNVNFGCGTVTVNYDGKKKDLTVVKDNAFIGCNTNLIAPVVVGENAYTAAGSTITKDVPDNALAIAREFQTNKIGWKRK